MPEGQIPQLGLFCFGDRLGIGNFGGSNSFYRGFHRRGFRGLGFYCCHDLGWCRFRGLSHGRGCFDKMHMQTIAGVGNLVWLALAVLHVQHEANLATVIDHAHLVRMAA